MEEEFEVFFGLGVAVHDDLATIGCGQVHIEHLHGGELFEHGPWRQSICTPFESGLEGDL